MSEDSQVHTRLNKTDLQAIDMRVLAEAGAAPTIESLRREGFHEDRALNALIDLIGGAGRTLTLLIAELIQAGAALIICVVFALLEYQRVYHGAVALGQADQAAKLIAIAIVAANVVHPIYRLRQLRGQARLQITHQTLRGGLEALWKRLVGKPRADTADLYHNPTLHSAATVITVSTILLAVYDILSPLLNQIFTGTAARPLPILIIEFAMGLCLSVAGVFFLQSAAHEIGVRTLTDQPKRLTAILESRQREYEDKIAVIRERIIDEHMRAKVEDRQRDTQLKITRSESEIAHPLSVNGA